MSTFAFVVTVPGGPGLVTSLVTTNSGSVQANASTALIDITSMNPQPEVGWTYDGNAFTQPAPVANKDTILGKVSAALTNNQAFLGLSSPTNAQVLAQIQALTRQTNALMRIVSEQLDSTAGT